MQGSRGKYEPSSLKHTPDITTPRSGGLHLSGYINFQVDATSLGHSSKDIQSTQGVDPNYVTVSLFQNLVVATRICLGAVVPLPGCSSSRRG